MGAYLSLLSLSGSGGEVGWGGGVAYSRLGA